MDPAPERRASHAYALTSRRAGAGVRPRPASSCRARARPGWAGLPCAAPRRARRVSHSAGAPRRSGASAEGGCRVRSAPAGGRWRAHSRSGRLSGRSWKSASTVRSVDCPIPHCFERAASFVRSAFPVTTAMLSRARRGVPAGRASKRERRAAAPGARAGAPRFRPLGPPKGTTRQRSSQPRWRRLRRHRPKGLSA